MTPWTFITNHAAVLTYLARHPLITALEVATAVGITERAVRKIIADLETSGYISKKRRGRHNIYRVNPQLPLRHVALQDIAVGELLTVLGRKARRPSRRSGSDNRPAPSE